MSVREEGYILASTLAALLAISVVAAALVGGSSGTLASVARAERSAVVAAALRSGLTVVASQLALDPGSRQIEISEQFDISISDESLDGRIEWETDKLDVNLASSESLESYLADAGVGLTTRDKVKSSADKIREHGEKIRLLSDFGFDSETETCLASLLTVFGGKGSYDPDAEQVDVALGQPAAGSRLSIELVHEGGNGIAVVVLMTGRPAAPVEILDWRDTKGRLGDKCDATNNHA